MLERRCSIGVEKLKAILAEHLHNGIPTSDLLEKTASFFTLRKALLSYNGYSKCSRDILRLFPGSEDNLAPLCLQQWPGEQSLSGLYAPGSATATDWDWDLTLLKRHWAALEIALILIYEDHFGVVLKTMTVAFMREPDDLYRRFLLFDWIVNFFFSQCIVVLFEAVVLLYSFCKKGTFCWVGLM